MFQFEIFRMVVDPYSLFERSYIILPLSRFVRQLIHTQSQKHHLKISCSWNIMLTLNLIRYRNDDDDSDLAQCIGCIGYWRSGSLDSQTKRRWLHKGVCWRRFIIIQKYCIRKITLPPCQRKRQWLGKSYSCRWFQWRFSLPIGCINNYCCTLEACCNPNNS